MNYSIHRISYHEYVKLQLILGMVICLVVWI